MNQTLYQLVLDLGNQLKAKRWKIATAESCTGGGLSFWITSVPGSSAWFDRGFITYSNKAKEETLGVHPKTITHFGAVSEACAREMAEGALHYSDAQFSVAITGIAGPDGGTVEKPIGTVWIACSGINKETIVNANIFSGNRQEVRELSIKVALEQLSQFILIAPPV